MPKITIENHGTYRVRKGTRLLDLFIQKNIPIPAGCNGQGRCGLCRVKISRGNQTLNSLEKIFITKSLAKKGYHLACCSRVRTDTIVSVPTREKKLRPVPAYGGLALDLGTTVIKGAVVNLASGEASRCGNVFNLQNALGGDVITRIGLALNNKYKILRSMLMQSINSLKRHLGIKKPDFTVVAGNPVMLSFYLNKPVDGLASFPFQGSLDQAVFQKKPPGYVFPIIGSFVGGDVIAGILASGLQKRNNNVLYIDLGTNGEVVLLTPKKILATSTAAGPAFEGTGISCGSLASSGAISSVSWRQGNFVYKTIDNVKPTGICASGLLDLLYWARKKNLVSTTGKLCKPLIVNGFSLTQNDIRKLQLAIGAIRTGIKILLYKAQLTSHSIGEIIITGEFGGKLSKTTLARLGLIPRNISKVTLQNDLPLKGAIKALANECKRAQINEIKKKSIHVELATHPNFQTEFARALRFSSWI